MKKQHTVKALLASLAAGSGILLSGCNSGNAAASGGQGQTATAAPIVASQAAKSLFSTNSCLTATAAFPASTAAWWYPSTGSYISVTNSCNTSQDLSNVAFSFTSQDSNGAAVPVQAPTASAAFNNWWYNGDSYAINFTANGALQTGTIATGSKATPNILPNSSITFSNGGGWALVGAAYNSTLAASSFAMNGGGVTPPVNQYGTLNVAIDTVNTDCKGTTTCSGKVIATVTNSSNVQVGNPIVVPDANLGGTLIQPITNLAPGTYTVSGSGIANTTITYNPTNAKGVVTANQTTTVTVKYDKTAPVATYGTATISLANVVPNYKGNVQVKVLDVKNSNNVVGSFSLAQGSSVTTDNLPVSDSTHAYSVQLVTGIADPVSGTYYVESSNTTLTIVKGSNTFAIPMVKSAIANNNVTVAISGLESGDTAATSFSDSNGKYVYANPASKANGSTTYKIESGLNLGTSVLASGSNIYTVNPITNTGVVNAAKTINATFKKAVTPVVDANKLVTVYLLIDTPAQLKQYIDDLSKVSKVNFNRVIFSFIKPTMTNYVSGSLANTGIMGYFNDGDGQGVAAFKQLQQAVALSKAKNIQTFISVGGWNYSCNYDVYGSNCGDAATVANGIHYDWFPDPADASQAATAKISYDNVIKLTNDLGMQGIDLDYEEFWHADQYAVTWQPGLTADWSTAIAQSILSAGGPTYANLMKYGTGAAVPANSTSIPAEMPKTVDKVAAIMHALEDNANSSSLLFATAAPPVGGTPITGFVYGDPSLEAVNTYGGLWWLGNLKGLWYNLTDKDQAAVNRFDSLGLMTYDLCSDNPGKCAPYLNAPLDLASQVKIYMSNYTNWLKNASPSAASLSVSQNGQVLFLPAKLNVKPKIQFGFEVNQPAYPQNVNGQLQLTNALVDTITTQQKNSDGVIIWQMYSKQNTAGNGTTVKYTVSKSCQTFLANDSRYDCGANFPASAN